MIMDFLKLSSDDSYYTPDHIIFMLNNYRAYVLTSKYEKGGTPADANYQTININFEEVDRIEGFSCFGKYLKSKEELPESLDVGHPLFAGSDLFNGDISIVSPQRFKYVGFNKWMKNITYATFEADHVYMKSCNPTLYYLEKGIYRDIFNNPLEAAKLSENAVMGSDGELCNEMDVIFPLEDNLLPLVMQYVVKDISGGTYRPKDSENNAQDDLSEIAQFIRTYAKTPYRNQILGQQ